MWNLMNKINKKNQKQTHRQRTDWKLSDRRRLKEIGEKDEGIQQKNKLKTTLRDTDNGMMITRGTGGVGGIRRGCSGDKWLWKEQT